ncbi:BON domain-containing protein [Pseudacidovorax intermedius]|uniref:Transporter n=1 Tax=Pseudacidovorax intermedius TaxID=433924 RepID=A0A147HB88_9BURK|nr:BON domain-containing protein [Pseudacidovorax intermedius]KTT27213.1 transporter [Pseudacidovorax intermedius]
MTTSPSTTIFRRGQRLACACLAVAALGGSLAGCVPLVVGGAAAAAGIGTLALDRRSSGVQLDDQGIELRAAARIREIANDNMNVTVISFNRTALLIGTVGSEADKQRAGEAVRGVQNVRGVVNEIVVGPALNIARRSNDAYITTKVKASLLDASDVPANSIKVVTEGGVVYLMGLVTRREADRATDIARGISGVEKVVRVFEFVSDDGQALPGGVGPSQTVPGTASGSVPLPPMAPLPAPAAPAPAPAPGVVTSPVR